MKENKLTPGSNMRWESSRMILPEHREMWLRHQKEDRMKFRPLWDEQQLEEFSHRLHEAAERLRARGWGGGGVIVTGSAHAADPSIEKQSEQKA